MRKLYSKLVNWITRKAISEDEYELVKYIRGMTKDDNKILITQEFKCFYKLQIDGNTEHTFDFYSEYERNAFGLGVEAVLEHHPLLQPKDQIDEMFSQPSSKKPTYH